MVGFRRLAFTAAVCLAASLPALADEQKPESTPPAFTPRLNTLMMVTQLGHFKLWYAGAEQNWPLANYELARIRDAIIDTERYFADKSGSKMSIMKPAADDLDQAIKAKDSAKFAAAYLRLTATCNACHEQNGVGFIKIRVPRLSPIETSPFSDESFSGR